MVTVSCFISSAELLLIPISNKNSIKKYFIIKVQFILGGIIGALQPSFDIGGIISINYP
ncbi:hypothetical protein PSI15_06420 [Xenorhabdus sp. PR6a]|nr:hypothetical protein [Xenorhabdus sp. PR6a]